MTPLCARSFWARQLRDANGSWRRNRGLVGRGCRIPWPADPRPAGDQHHRHQDHYSPRGVSGACGGAWAALWQTGDCRRSRWWYRRDLPGLCVPPRILRPHRPRLLGLSRRTPESRVAGSSCRYRCTGSDSESPLGSPGNSVLPRARATTRQRTAMAVTRPESDRPYRTRGMVIRRLVAALRKVGHRVTA